MISIGKKASSMARGRRSI